MGSLPTRPQPRKMPSKLIGSSGPQKKTMNEKPTPLSEHTVSDLKARLSLLNAVIRDAQGDGDDRWRNLLSDQRELNAALVAAIKRERAARGEPEPEPVIVNLKPAPLVARRAKEARNG